MIYLDHILEATSGVLLYAGKQNHFDAFCHDTRQLIPGEMFVAVRGEQGDGHDYLLDAVQRGAAGLLLETRIIGSLPHETRTSLERAGVATIAVADTRLALQNYASFILRLWHPTIIAVTGSTGKTSTKEAIAAVLASNFAIFKSWQNYNDLLGLPLSLGRLEDRHEFAVLELSCDHPGEISDLCRITRPDIGILTNISPTQQQFFGTVERLAAELGTLLTALPEDGLAIVNGDDELIRSLTAACVAPVTTFTPSKVRDVQVGWTVSCVLPEMCEGANKERLVLLSSRFIGRHFVTTMLAAYYVGRHCGLKDEEIQQALVPLHSLAGRLHALPGLHSTTLLDDTHNANPASVIAGLEALRELPTDCRIAVLGDMLRLGNYEEEAHRVVGRKAVTCVDYLITRGERAALIAEAAQEAGLATEQVIVTSTHEDAAKAARSIMSLAGENSRYTQPHTKAIVLVKGSEETRMERITEMLMAEPARAPELLVRQTPGWKQIVVMRADRPTWVEIDLSAIANNTRQIKALVGPRVRILASLKADAYGHGAVKVARTVLHNGASMLGVATVSEATPLREAGIDAPILVFGYVPPWQMREAVRLDLVVTLYSVNRLKRSRVQLLPSSRESKYMSKSIQVWGV